MDNKTENRNIYQSMGCLTVVVSFLDYRSMLKIQFCGRKFYDQIVPMLMTNEQIQVKIGLYYHLFKGYEYDSKIILKELQAHRPFHGDAWPEKADLGKLEYRPEYKDGIGGVYMGQWSVGKSYQDLAMQGKGREIDAFENIYDGWWLNGLQCGLGRQICKDGHVYFGLWRSGIKGPRGVQIYPDDGG